MWKESIYGEKYGIGIIGNFKAKRDVLFFHNKSEAYDKIWGYKLRSERVTGLKLQTIRMDGAGENWSEKLKEIKRIEGVEIEYSLYYVPEINGVAESLMQERGLQKRTLITNSWLSNHLWNEEMRHGNWLRSRLPSSQINGNIPIFLWKQSTYINLGKIPYFGQIGYAFIYIPATAPNKKIIDRFIHSHFIGMESDERLCNIYISETNEVK